MDRRVAKRVDRELLLKVLTGIHTEMAARYPEYSAKAHQALLELMENLENGKSIEPNGYIN